jgi:hypothetical protein
MAGLASDPAGTGASAAAATMKISASP